MLKTFGKFPTGNFGHDCTPRQKETIEGGMMLVERLPETLT